MHLLRIHKPVFQCLAMVIAQREQPLKVAPVCPIGIRLFIGTTTDRAPWVGIRLAATVSSIELFYKTLK